jgi:peptidoglycan/LPS O-acetylase OafA/YrhL
MLTQNKRLASILLAVPLLLLVPFVAMQFTHEVNWTLFDFIAAGGLLLGTGLLCEFVLRNMKNSQYRTAILVAVLFVFLLIWIELAVGIFGTPFAGN